MLCLNAITGLSLILTLWLPNKALAAIDPTQLYNITREPALVSALEELTNSPYSGTVEYLIEHDSKVMFKDLAAFGPQNAYSDALTIITFPNMQQVIYIHDKHISAPSQALAAIISHETMHNDQLNSLQEEIAAWDQEAACWQTLKTKYPLLDNITLGEFALVDRLNGILKEKQNQTLGQSIRQNPVYKDLPEHSPGF